MKGLNRPTQLNILIGCAHDLLGALHCAQANETNDATRKVSGNAISEKQVREKFEAFALGMNGTYGGYGYMFDGIGSMKVEKGGKINA